LDDCDFAAREQLNRLRVARVEDDIVADRIEFREESLHALIGAEHFVDLLRRDAVGHQDLLGQPADRTNRERALARTLLRIENVGNRRRPRRSPRRRYLLFVIRVENRHELGGYATFPHRVREIVFPIAELAQIEALEETFVATNDGVRNVAEDNIGSDVLRLHHRTYLAEIRKPGRLDDLDSGRLFK